MMLTKLIEADAKVVGTKQTLKALKGELVDVLFVAKDADVKVIRPLIDLANKKLVTIEYVNSMNELGQAAGIEVGAATVALLKQQAS